MLIPQAGLMVVWCWCGWMLATPANTVDMKMVRVIYEDHWRERHVKGCPQN